MRGVLWEGVRVAERGEGFTEELSGKWQIVEDEDKIFG